MQTTATIPQQPNVLQKNVQSILLTGITGLILGCFGFLWNMNARMAIMEDHDTQRTESIKQVQNTVQAVQFDITSVKQTLADQKTDRDEERRRK